MLFVGYMLHLHTTTSAIASDKGFVMAVIIVSQMI